MEGPSLETLIVGMLAELNISTETISHTAVMTSEAQVEALQGADGAVTKNLFLKDKKGRLYLLTALHSTKVDLRTLAARLGLGRGNLRLAPDELLTPVLGVAPGAATPLALAHPPAAGVVLLLDSRLRGEARLFVHPGVNTASTALPPAQLEAFLRRLGREPTYVDLEAAPRIDKDNPPDLKHVADGAAPMVAPDDGAAAPAPAAPAPSKADKKKAAASAAAAAALKAGRAAGGGGGGGGAARRQLDVNGVTEVVVGLAAARLAGAGAGAGDGEVLRRLTADVAMELNALRNAAYAAGFQAARGAAVAALGGRG